MSKFMIVVDCESRGLDNPLDVLANKLKVPKAAVPKIAMNVLYSLLTGDTEFLSLSIDKDKKVAMEVAPDRLTSKGFPFRQGD